MFAFLVDILNENGRSIHAYRLCAESGHAAMSNYEDAAVAFFLLAQSAERFADMNERMPISAADIDEAYETFLNNVERLDAAWSDGEDSGKLAAINEVARNAIQQ